MSAWNHESVNICGESTTESDISDEEEASSVFPKIKEEHGDSDEEES